MMLDPLPDLEKVYALIVQVEESKMLNTTSDTGNFMSMNIGQQMRVNVNNQGPIKGGPF